MGSQKISKGTPPSSKFIAISEGKRNNSNISNKQEKKYLQFGFKFFEERQKFGLKQKGKKIPNSWMLSFIKKIKELSLIEYEELIENRKLQQKLRYHPINWNAKNIPIQKKDVCPSDELCNEEIEFMQFEISTATGRFGGFFDKDYIFQIVLVDPLHNLQPAGGKYGHKVRDCVPLGTDYEILISKIQDIHSRCAKITKCQHKDELKDVSFIEESYPIIICDIDEKLYKRMDDLLNQGFSVSCSDCFEQGLAEWEKLCKE